MDFEKFLKEAANGLKAMMEKDHPFISVEPVSVDKFQGSSYRGIRIREKDSNIAPSFQMEDSFRLYQNGESMEDILQTIYQIAENALKGIPDINMEKVTDYESIKDRIFLELVSAQRNDDMLKNVPHVDMEDLSLIYRLDFGKDNYGSCRSAVITDAMLKSFGVSAEQFHEDAIRNAEKSRPASLRTLAETLGLPPEMTPAGVPALYVATCGDTLFGAAVIGYKNFMDMAAERIGGDFYVLPSSLHEVLLLKDDGRSDIHELESMVRAVNSTEVRPEDQLSDNVYHYDAQARVFELAGNYEQRIKDEQSLENEVGILAADLDQFAYEYDTHGYHDAVEDRDQNVASIREDLMNGESTQVEAYLQGVIDEDSLPEEKEKAQSLLDRIDSLHDRLPKLESAKENDHIFYVAECSEYPVLGEFHDGLSLKEAYDIYNAIPDERMNGRKSIGISIKDGLGFTSMTDLYVAGKMQTDFIREYTSYGDRPDILGAIHGLEELTSQEKGAERDVKDHTSRKSVREALKDKQDQAGINVQHRQLGKAHDRKKGDVAI